LPVALPETELADDAILVFPNPSDGNVSIQSTIKVEKVEIYHYQGKLAGSFDAGASQAILDLKSFRPGVYLLKIWNNNNIVTRKIVLIP
jgi:hypothetical protein